MNEQPFSSVKMVSSAFPVLLGFGLFLFSACKPIVEIEEPAKPMAVGLMVHPWNSYFSAAPTLLLVETLPDSVMRLLIEQQRLAKAVIDGHGTAPLMDIAPLEMRLADLKTMIPDAETRSGMVYHGTSRTTSFYTYDTYSYPAFRLQSKSSSPDLVRSVHGIVHNTTIDNIEQRISALNQLVSIWSRRNSTMGASGSSGLMRSANEAYLAELRKLIREFNALQGKRDEALARHAILQQDHARNLEQWRSFEQNELLVLQTFFERNAVHTVVCDHPEHRYELPRPRSGGQYVIACPIGPRMLYFPIKFQPSQWHPFVKVDLGKAPDEG